MDKFYEARCEVCNVLIGYKAHPHVRVRCFEHGKPAEAG